MTIMHEVEYADGYKTAMAANTIANNLFAQVGQDGRRFVLFEEIIDHRTNGTEIKRIGRIHPNVNGNKQRRETTNVWEVCIR